MELDTYLSQVQGQLAAAAALGDDRTREVAAALTVAAVPAVRLALFAAISDVADEITAALLDHPGAPTVAARLDGDEVALDVRFAAVEAAQPDPSTEGEATARISLRLPDALKGEIDAAAERDGVSVNTWLVRAAATAARRGAPDTPEPSRSRGRKQDNYHITGWINS